MYQAVNSETGERGPVRETLTEAALDMLDWEHSYVDIVEARNA